MDQLPIGEVARRSGLRPSTLRYYEHIGLLPAPERVNGRRRFDSNVLQRLAVIQFAKSAGFSIAEIRVLLEGFDPAGPPLARWSALARGKIDEIEETIRRAEAMKRILETGLRCGCLRYEDCVLFNGTSCMPTV
jgi:MerR family transcriptional regulator, redox-sensitive transcriptional activator SoxR